jgi:translocation protein SEC62
MQGRPAGQPQPITPGPPNPVAIAMANFLRGQDLKLRTCILNGDRKDMFRGVSLCVPRTASGYLVLTTE